MHSAKQQKTSFHTAHYTVLCAKTLIMACAYVRLFPILIILFWQQCNIYVVSSSAVILQTGIICSLLINIQYSISKDLKRLDTIFGWNWFKKMHMGCISNSIEFSNARHFQRNKANKSCKSYRWAAGSKQQNKSKENETLQRHKIDATAYPSPVTEMLIDMLFISRVYESQYVLLLYSTIIMVQKLHNKNVVSG